MKERGETAQEGGLSPLRGSEKKKNPFYDGRCDTQRNLKTSRTGPGFKEGVRPFSERN